MEEKVLIVSKLYNIKRFRNICIAIGVLLFAFAIVMVGSRGGWSDLLPVTFYDLFWLGLIVLIFGAPAWVGIIVYAILSKMQIVVTNRRVYGSVAFGKRVDLPLDSISAVSTSIFGGVGISTSSGVIKFKLIKNKRDIHNTLSKLLIERQTAKAEAPAPATDSTGEIKKFKELLDSGVITQDEFDAKKKQLLGF